MLNEFKSHTSTFLLLSRMLNEVEASFPIYIQTRTQSLCFLGKEDWILGWIKVREVSWEGSKGN